MWMSYAFVLSLGIVSLDQVVTQGSSDPTTDGQTNGNSGPDECSFAENDYKYIAVKWHARSSTYENYKHTIAADWNNKDKAFVLIDPNNVGNERVYAEYDGVIDISTHYCQVTFDKTNAKSTLLMCDITDSVCIDIGKRDLSLALNAYCMNYAEKVQFGYLENFFWSSFIYPDTEWDTYKYVKRGYFSSSNHDYPFIVTQFGEKKLFTSITSEEEVECYQIYYSERKYVINSKRLENQVGKNNFFNFHGCTISSNQEYIINKEKAVVIQEEGTLHSRLQEVDAECITNGMMDLMTGKFYEYITGNPNCIIKICKQVSTRDDVISIQQGPDFHLERSFEGLYYHTEDPAGGAVGFSCYSDITDKCKNAKYFYYYENYELVPSDVHQCGDEEDSNVCQSGFTHEYISLVQITNKFGTDCAWGGSASTVYFHKVDNYNSGDCLMKKSNHLYFSQTDTDGNVNLIEYEIIAALPSHVDKTSCDVETSYSFSTNSALCVKKDSEWLCDDALTLLTDAAMDLSA